MPITPEPRDTYRNHLAEEGLRPVEVWLPDISSPEFAAEAHRQSLLVGRSPHAKEDQAFVDSVSDVFSD